MLFRVKVELTEEMEAGLENQEKTLVLQREGKV